MPVVAAHQHPETAGGSEFPGTADPFEFLLPLTLAAQVSGVPQLVADVDEVLLRLRLRDLLQNALQILQIPAGNGHLLPEIPLRRLGLRIPLIVFGGVLLGSEQRVQLDGDRRALGIVVVLAGKLALPPLHPVEIGGDQIPADPQMVPVLGSGIVLLLQSQLPPQPVPGGGGGADQVRAPLPHPLLLLPGLIKFVQHPGKAVAVNALHRRAVLADGQVREIRRPAVLPQTYRGKLSLPDAGDQLLQFLPQPLPLLRSHLAKTAVRLPRRPERQFPGYQGRNAEIRVQQKGVRLPLRVGGIQLFPKALLRLLRHGEPSHGGRGLIVKPRQHLAAGGHFRVHPAQAINHTAVSVQQDQVGPAAHSLQHQRPAARLAEVVGNIQFHPHQPLQRRLGDVRHPGAHQMLAQQHTKHGRLRRIIPGQLRQLDAGSIGTGIEQQPLISPQQQNHLVPGRLLDLVDPQPQQLGPQLLEHSLQANGVKRHGYPPPS